MDVREFVSRARSEIGEAETVAALEELKIKYLGRKGELNALLRGLKDLPEAERRAKGPELQRAYREVEEFLREKLMKFAALASQEKQVDLTAPGKKALRGHMHPLSIVDRDVRRIFSSMNFSVVEGPELETEHYNFDALNIPEHHPAREMWDTFWVKQPDREKKKILLRTHTSPMQIRYMEEHKPPFQIIVPGRVFRYEATDMSHEINFYQVEGLMVGKDISLANFKFVIEAFFKKFFAGKKIEFRYRPSYFPFVEPGVEVDIKLGAKWLEVMGAGMVHRSVFEVAHYNPEDLQGFAFGVGLDRLAMIKYGIPDIRLFYSGDLRFAKQF